MDSADALYGWPAAALGATFQKAVKTIQEVRERGGRRGGAACCILVQS